MDVFSQLGAVALVLGLLVAVLWCLRRRGVALPLPARRGTRRMECLEKLTLGPQHTLHLVRVGDKALLVAASPGGCSLLESQATRALETGGGH
jgi:flagellar biosynthetic protein FliO